MVPVVVLAITLGPWLASEPGADLVTAAAASSRPADCSARGKGGKAPSVWERARSPQRATFCAAIAEAHAKLGSDLAGAEAALTRADAAWPDRAATKVGWARVRLARGEAAPALKELEAALAQDPRALTEPAALRDHARALALVGRSADALVVYRALVPQSSLLPRPARAEALVEAGLCALAAPRRDASATASSVASAEAVAILREARAMGASPIEGEIALALALALDRAGDAAGAAARLADAGRLQASAETVGVRVTDRGDALALSALAAELSSRTDALALWDRFLAESPTSAWRAAAERRRDALRSPTSPQGSPPRRRPKPVTPRPVTPRAP